MTFRCKSCQSAVSVPTAEVEERATSVRCRKCGQRYELSARGTLHAASVDTGGKARQLAMANGIDLPAAYSVALDIMTLDVARSGPAPGAAAVATAVAERPRRTTRRNLTSAPAQSAPVAVVVGSRGRRFRWLLVAALAVASGLFLLNAAVRERADVEVQSLTVGSAEVLSDSHQRVVEIHGPDPRSVLNAFSRVARAQGRYAALGVVPSPWDPANARLGLFRDPEEPASVLAITIRADLKRGRWIAGNGIDPVPVSKAPPGAETAVKDR